MMKLDRKVFIWQWAVMAETEEEAITKVKDRQGEGSVDGKWSASASSSDVFPLEIYLTEPTEEDLDSRVERKRAPTRSSRRLIR